MTFLKFFETYSLDNSAFVDYFQTYYANRIELWSSAYRNFPHASTDNNMYCESFHNKLKTIYLNRKANKRLDTLIITLLNVECDTYLTHASKLLYDCPIKSVSLCKDRHKRGLKIPDSSIQKLSDSSWLIASQSKKLYSTEIRK